MVAPTRPAPAVNNGDEVEWQFDAPDAAAALEALRCAAGPAGLSLRSLPAEQIVDVYFDSRDGRLRRAGWVLRARTAGGRCEATLKSTSWSSRGPQRRREISEPVPAADAGALIAAQGPVGTRLRLLLGAASLARALTVRTRREHVEASYASGPVADVALDDTTLERAAPGAGADHLVRLELESIGPAGAPLHDLAERLGACASLRRAERVEGRGGAGRDRIARRRRGRAAASPPARHAGAGAGALDAGRAGRRVRRQRDDGARRDRTPRACTGCAPPAGACGR